MKIILLFNSIIFLLSSSIVNAQIKAGAEALGTQSYDNYQTPEFCGTSCHTDFYQQWKQAMMSQAYTHEWDEIEYFKLAVPHAEKDEKVAEVKAGCNGCHAPIAFLAGDVPPPKPEMNSRANESVSCDLLIERSGPPLTSTSSSSSSLFGFSSPSVSTTAVLVNTGKA